MNTGPSTLREDPAAGPSPPSLVEREVELTAVAAALDAAMHGSGRALIVEGDPGMGKTRLLAEAALLAEQRGIECLRARGAELERGFAFGAMRQLLERRVAGLGEAAREALLADAAAPASVLLDARMPSEPLPRDARFALAHGLYWVCARLAESGPLAILVDDFHWLDGPSADALAYLTERIDELSIAVLLAVRTEVGDRHPGIRQLHASPGSRTVSLAPLSEAGTRSVLTELLGSHGSGFGATAHRVTAGNPFLVRELALAVATERIETDERGAVEIAKLAPTTVTRWALGRIEPLSQAAGAIARSLAVLEEAELDVLALHAGVDPSSASEAIERLAAAGLVEGRPLRFAHPLVRSALGERMPEATREPAHRRAAEALRDCGAPIGAVASQLLLCEPRGEGWAADALRSAAAAAIIRGDAVEAAALLRRAVAELGEQRDPGLLLELGQAQGALGDHRGAIEQLELAEATTTDAGVRAGARVGLAHCRYLSGDFRGAFQVAGQVLAEIPAGRGGRLEAELLVNFLMAGRAIPECVDEVGRWLREPRRGPGGELTPAELVRLEMAALDAFLRGRRADAVRLVGEVEQALAGAVSLAEVPTLLTANAGFVLAGIGEHERSAAIYERALGHAVGRGSPLEAAEVREARVAARWWRGDVAGCLADVEAILAVVGADPDPAKLPMRMCQAMMLLERGERKAAEEALRYGPEIEGRLRGTWGWLALPFGRAGLALAGGDWPGARREAEATGERLAAVAAESPEFLPWRSLAARATASMGSRPQALDLARDELDLARAIGSSRASGFALATLGAIEGSPETLAEAVAELDRASAPLAAARARLELGVCLRRARRPRDARTPLREALDLARRMGSTVIAERAHSELRAAGGRPRRERTTGLEALTPRELEIAELAATGLANPEIAARLFISRKTVEAHLRSVFRKLAVSDRAELRFALGGEVPSRASARTR